jgi:hypothetical protein
MDRKDFVIAGLCLALVLALLWGITRSPPNWRTADACECCQMGGAVDGDEAGSMCLTPDDYPP